MDKREELITLQTELLQKMTKYNLQHTAADFFGSPEPEDSLLNLQEPSPDPVQERLVTANQEQAVESSQEMTAAEMVAVETIEELKAELETYIGLATIKKEVNNLINMVTVHQLREENHLPNTDLSLHMVFSGNPGTGKTMIARLMARIYRSLGILSQGQLVEVDRSELVAGYIGQTAAKTTAVLAKAKGGVLFIDEAYSLAGKGESDYGQEAIDTLLKAMEDNRDDLVVIVAGYDDLMKQFIHSNPGLASRFNRYLHFDDYQLEEMMDIFLMQCKKGQYQLEDEAKEAVRRYIQQANTNSIAFGNARGVRNIFEHILVAQANRLAAMEQVTREDLLQITLADVQTARGEQV